MIRQCTPTDFQAIYEIINDGAQAYKDIIPDDRWHEPYMSSDELKSEIESGIVFWGLDQNDQLPGLWASRTKARWP